MKNQQISSNQELTQATYEECIKIIGNQNALILMNSTLLKAVNRQMEEEQYSHSEWFKTSSYYLAGWVDGIREERARRKKVNQ